MAEWSELPRELLQEIINRLNSTLYILRFRSVCSTWRQSSPSIPPSNGSPTPFPPPSLGISLSKRSIFLLSPPQTLYKENNPNSWIIKLEEKTRNTPQGFNLFFPLLRTQITPLPITFPRLIDISNIGIRELGCEYFLRCTDKACFKGDFLNLLMDKVAHISGVLLTIHVCGRLALFNNVDNEWHIISDDVDLPYDDVIALNGKFYAVDYTGRTVLVEVNDISNGDYSVILVARPVCGGDKKRLVEIGGELMLVDVYMGLPPWKDDHDMEDLDEFVHSRSMWFKVFRLDREGKNWVEVKNLGKYVLFLGMYSSFSTSVVDLLCHRGNCIYFSFPDNFYPNFNEDDDTFKFHCGGVYNLEDASISYSDLFWPPPPWIASTSWEVNLRA